MHVRQAVSACATSTQTCGCVVVQMSVPHGRIACCTGPVRTARRRAPSAAGETPTAAASANHRIANVLMEHLVRHRE
jgi:hypothetical protein